MQPGPVPGYLTHAEPRGRRCCSSVRGLQVVCMRYTMTTLIHKSADWRRWWWPYTRVLGQVAAAQRGGYLFRQRTGGLLRPEHQVGRAPGGDHFAHVEHGAVRWWFRSRTIFDLCRWQSPPQRRSRDSTRTFMSVHGLSRGPHRY